MDSSPLPYLGYNFCSAIEGNLIPQRLQNLCIRDYAASHLLKVAFSASEYSDPSQALILFAQFETASTLAGCIFFSIQLLPADDRLRKRFFSLIREHRLSVHFALENLRLLPDEDPQTIERTFRISGDPRLDQTREALIAAHRITQARMRGAT